MAAACLVGALPSIAGATDYCVDTTPACGTKNIGTLQEALTQAAAAPDADRVFLSAGTYTAPTASGFAYNQLGGPVEIVGAAQGGPSETLVTSPPGATGTVLRLMGGSGTSVHDLKIQLPQNLTSGLTGLETNGVARQITVRENVPSPANVRNGVLLHGGALEDSLVTLGVNTGGVILDDGGTVRGSGIAADLGIMSYGGLVERTGVVATSFGVIARRPTTIRSSRLKVQGATATGILADVQPGFDTTVIADGVNILGPGGPSAIAARAYTVPAPASSAAVTLKNSLLRGFATALRADAGGSGVAHIDASYSDYDATNNVASPGNASISETNVSNVGDVGFEDVTDGDYTLLPGSQLVDAGDPATGQGLDYVGNPLVTDGNLDGSARRDIGAFELPGPLPGAGDGQPAPGAGQPSSDGGGQGSPPALDTQAPLVSAFRAAPRLFAVARAGRQLAAGVATGTRFRYTLSEPARVTLKIQRALAGRRTGGKCVRPGPGLAEAKRCTRYRTIGALSRSANGGANSTRFTGRLGKRALRPGGYRAVITAADPAGNRSARRTARFRVAGS